MAACGDGLFRSLFEGTRQGAQLWTMIEPHLNATRVEITTGIPEATAILGIDPQSAHRDIPGSLRRILCAHPTRGPDIARGPWVRPSPGIPCALDCFGG
jgi:hypothetical protein